jgi:hypothetical protein
MIHLLSYEEANERVEQAKRRQSGIEHDYTDDEVAKLIKQSKRERWSVTLELLDGSLWTTKWRPSKKAAKEAAVMFLAQNNIRSEVNGWLCNMADAMEEISFIGM